MVVTAFCPQFQALLDNITDEKIDELISLVEPYINYIKTGEKPLE